MALIILVFGFVFAVLAAWGWPAPIRPNLGWLALACLILYLIVTHAGSLLHGG